jgi:hypothetical protein
MWQLTNAQKRAAAEAHAAGVTPKSWPPAAAPCPPGDAWSFGPSGWTYGQVRLTLKEFEQATAPAIAGEARPRPAPKDPGVSETLCRRLKAKGFHMGNWPSPEAAEVMDAWVVGPSGAEYRGNAASPQAVTFKQYASWLGNMPTQGYRVGFLGTATGLGVVRFVARDELLDVDLWHAEGSSIYVTIAPSDILPLDPVDLIARGLQRLVDADQAQHIAKLIITGQLPGVKYEA